MKKFLSLVVLCFTATQIPIFAETVIRAKVKNAEGNKMGYQYEEAVIRNWVYRQDTIVDGALELRLDILDPVHIKFFLNDHQIAFLVLPNDTLIFEVDGNDVPNTLRYQCRNMQDQEYTTRLGAIESIWMLGTRPYRAPNSSIVNVPNELSDSLREAENAAKQRFFQSFNNQPHLSPYLRQAIIDTSYLPALVKLTKRMLAGAKVGEYTLKMRDMDKEDLSDEAIDNMLSQITIERADMIRNATYMDFLQRYNDYAFRKWRDQTGIAVNEENWIRLRLQFMNEHFKNDTVKYAIMAYSNGTNNLRRPEFYSEQLRFIEELYPSGPYNARMRQLELGLAGLKQGMKAPDFTLRDLNGKEVSLSDFKGKVVYIDFWASWCLPCVAENQAVKKLKPKYKDKDLVFLYITRDKNDSVWRDAIRKQEIEGIHLMGGGHVVFDQYQAEGVPLYVLIDKKGYIISSNAPRPSHRARLEEMIDKALSAQ